MNRKNISFSVAALFIMLQITGCAFGTRRVSLLYNSSNYPSSVTGSPTVRIAPFNDRRADHSLGCVRNGWGMKTASVEAKPGEPPVTTWIEKALGDELRRSGCSVVNNNSAQFVISGDLQRVYVDSYMSMQGEISIAVSMKNSGRPALNELYHAEASKVNWWCSSGEFQQTLHMTLQNLMAKMVPDITGAMSTQYADLPAAAESQSALSTPASESQPAAEALPAVQSEPAAAPSVATDEPSKTAVDATTQLKKLKELKDLGLLTEEEFEAKRKELAGQL